MDNFLKIEYEQCLSLLKHYDERHLRLVIYASGLSTAVPSIVFAFHELGGQASRHFWLFVGLISIASALGLLMIVVALSQNRLYFTFAARQVNAIRKVCIKTMSVKGFENHMYIDTKFNAFKWASAHTLFSVFVALHGVYLAMNIEAVFEAGDNPADWMPQREAYLLREEGYPLGPPRTGKAENPSKSQTAISGNSQFTFDSPGVEAVGTPRSSLTGKYDAVFKYSEKNKNTKETSSKQLFYRVTLYIVNGNLVGYKAEEISKEEYDKLTGKKRKSKKSKNPKNKAGKKKD